MNCLYSVSLKKNSLFVTAISRRSLLPVLQWHPGDPLISRDPIAPEFPNQPALCACTRHDTIERSHRRPSFQVPSTEGECGLAANQRRGYRAGGEPAGRGCTAGAHQYSDLLQLGRGAMPAVPEPRGPGSGETPAAGPAHRGVAPPLPGIPHPQSARSRGEAGGGRQGARAAAGSAEEAGGEGEGADRRAQAEEEGYPHPAVDARATNPQQPEGTAETLNAHSLGGYRLHICISHMYGKQTASSITPTPFTPPPPPPQGPLSVIVPKIYSQLRLCASHMEGKKGRLDRISVLIMVLIYRKTCRGCVVLVWL